MAATGAVLCIHHDPEQLTLLREKGYGLVTATNGREGLRLLMSRPVDAVVLEYYLEMLDGAMVADEIRRARPEASYHHGRGPDGTTARGFKVGGHLSGQICRSALSLGCCPFPFDYQSRAVLSMSELPNAFAVEELTMSKASRRHILVVDDNPGVRETLAMLLRCAGYDVAVAEDGFAALSQLRKTLPDVVVSDLEMPRMSGFELLSIVRRRFPQILTVAMSGGVLRRWLARGDSRGRVLRQRRATQGPASKDSAVDHFNS